MSEIKTYAVSEHHQAFGLALQAFCNGWTDKLSVGEMIGMVSQFVGILTTYAPPEAEYETVREMVMKNIEEGRNAALNFDRKGSA